MRLIAAAIACLAAAAACAQSAQAAVVASRQQTVALTAPHGVRRTPQLASEVLTSVAARRPITGERTVLPVLARKVDGSGRTWLRVRLPGRVLHGTPPPRSGWISASHSRRASTLWHIVVELDRRRVLVYHQGRLARAYSAIVGAPATPTPRGEYFVEENVKLSAGQPGAPFALATSDRSNVLQEFDGGPGQIALHGLDGLGGVPGTAVSHGCIRLPDAEITWLAARIAPGVPLTIR